MLLVSASVFAFLAVLRQVNLYKIAMMFKRLVRGASKLRHTLKAGLNLGFRESQRGSLDDEELRRRNCGYIR